MCLTQILPHNVLQGRDVSERVDSKKIVSVAGDVDGPKCNLCRHVLLLMCPGDLHRV